MKHNNQSNINTDYSKGLIKKEVTTTRIVFIDLMRAYAILMMVQGHAVKCLLANVFNDSSFSFIHFLRFMRGVTAPVFFFASGTIFSYLLFREESKGIYFDNPRVKKGIKRAIMLIAIGYLLQINPKMLQFLSDFDVNNQKWFFMVHVLHVIGISIFFLVIFYLISYKTKINFGVLLFIIGNSLFLIDPSVKQFDWNAVLPMPLANFFTKQNNSAFVLVPWSGISFLGAAFGFLIYKYKKLYSSKLLFITIILCGILLSFFSSSLLKFIYYNLIHWDNINYLYLHNAMYFRLGNILIITGVLGLIAQSFKIPKIISTIGSETLTIYVTHSIIIYGSLIGVGLKTFWENSLNPYEMIIVVILVEALMIYFAYKAKDFKTYVKNTRNKINKKLFKQYSS